MIRALIALTLGLFAAALLTVPAALAKGGGHSRAVRIGGVCTGQSTSKLKLSREGRGIEVEFQVDQNRNGVPWKVTLRRNGNRVASLTATTRSPSGSFEIRRVIAGQLRTDRITATATRPGETCTARSGSGSSATAGATTTVDDHGHDPAPHS
jgi:hypothetical protein